MPAFKTRERSSGSVCTMRSRAIRASARQLFVIYAGDCVSATCSERWRRGGEALTTRVWKSVLVHSPVRSRCGRLSGLEMYLVRSVVKGSVLSYKHTTFKQKGMISLIIYGSAAGEPPSKMRANAYVRYGQEHSWQHELRQIDGRRIWFGL